MGRILFPETKQEHWINKNIKKSGLSVVQLARICNVSPRTFRDWKREKFTISSDSAMLLEERFSVSLPQYSELVDDYWYVTKGAKKGALRRMELYGPPGTPEGRRKGGRESQLRRKLYPELFKNCNIAKTFNMPGESEELAELVGIILGDGGISDYQVKISLNRELEENYLQFVASLIRRLLGERPRRHHRNTLEKVDDICISGVRLVEFLQKLGLKKGNKVAKQVGVPWWIWKKIEFASACLRGLIDTDGCVFLHSHVTHKVRCLNLGMCFSNHSQPLLDFVNSSLTRLGYTARRGGHNVFLYREKEVLKYANEIGFSNKHHIKRLSQFIENKYVR